MMISLIRYQWLKSREKSRGESTSLSMRWLLIWISCLKMLKNTTPMSLRYFRYRTSCSHRYLFFLSMARFQDYSPTCFYRGWLCWSNARPFLRVWCIIEYCHTNMIVKTTLKYVFALSIFLPISEETGQLNCGESSVISHFRRVGTHWVKVWAK